MNLQQLQYFLATADRGSFSAAAHALHLSQPSVSEQVRRLEAELGVALFARVGRGLVLTEAGRTLRPHAEAVLRGGAARRASRCSPCASCAAGRSASARSRRRATTWAPTSSPSSAARHPNVRVRILGLNSAEAAQDVRDGRLEAAIVALPVDDEGLDVRPVTDDELFFASTDASHLRKPMTIERLAELPLVMGDASYRLQDPTRRQLAELAQRAGVTLEPVVDVETVATVLDLVARGRRRHDPRARPARRARARACPSGSAGCRSRDPIMITLAFVSRRDAPLSPAARVMVDLIEERLRRTTAAAGRHAAAAAAGLSGASVPARRRGPAAQAPQQRVRERASRCCAARRAAARSAGTRRRGRRARSPRSTRRASSSGARRARAAAVPVGHAVLLVVVQVRRDLAGVDGRQRDARAAQLVAQRLGEHPLRGLRAAVDRGPRERAQRRAGGHDDDVPVRAVEQVRQAEVDGAQRAVPVDLAHLQLLLERLVAIRAVVRDARRWRRAARSRRPARRTSRSPSGRTSVSATSHARTWCSPGSWAASAADSSVERAASPTTAPRSASARVSAAPIPREAPVTKAACRV